jgi:hypothetical protein
MAEYSIAARTSQLTINTSSFELRALTALRVREIGITATATTASTFGLGRPANTTGIGGTVIAGLTHDGTNTTTSGLVITGWSTAPTAPAQYLRRLQTAAIGAGVIWTFPSPIVVPAGGALVLFNITAVGATDIYVQFDD